MSYRIYNPDTGHGFDPVETEDPAAWVADKAAQAGFDADGYTWEPSAYTEPTPPAPDPAAKLAADKDFGQELIDSFVAGSRANNFDLAQTRAINSLLSEVEIYLNRGSIHIAREALAELEPTPLFPAQAKAYYLSIIDTYLSS